MPTHIDDLREELSAHRVVCVVGAGVAIAASHDPDRRELNVANWIGLLESGVSECVKVRIDLPSAWEDRVRGDIASGDVDDLLAAAEKITAKLGGTTGGDFARWIRETIGSLPLVHDDVPAALGALSAPILTTNYDTLIEQGTGRPAITWRDRAAAERALQGDDDAVVHVHGVWNRPDTVILGARSYERILGDEHVQAMERALRAMRTLLFVGYGAGLNDPNFGALRDWARSVFAGSECRHYRLVLDSEVNAAQAQHSQDERISVIGYGATHAALPAFLRALAPNDTVAPAGIARPSASTGHARDAGWMYLGPRLVASGEQVAASGARWSLRVDRLVVGEIADLNELAERFEEMHPDERYVVLEEHFEGRQLAGAPSWRRDGAGFVVDVEVAPSVEIEDVSGVVDLDFGTLGSIRGERVVQRIAERHFSTPIGSWMLLRELGTRLPDLVAVAGREHRSLEHLVRLELSRLVRVPRWDSALRRLYVPIAGVERIAAVVLDNVDDKDNAIGFSVELSLRGIGLCQWTFQAPLVR